MQATLRTPRRPRSFVAQVYPYLLQDAPRRVIESATGLSGHQLNGAIQGNWRLGYVVRPGPAELRRRLRENTSAAKGGVWLDVRRYEALDLTAKQTQVALKRLDGQEYSQAQIQAAYSRARHRHGLVRPIAELTVEAQRDKFRSERALLEIVRARSAAYVLVRQHGWNKPATLRGWHLLEGHLSATDLATLAEVLDGAPPTDLLAQRYLLDLFTFRRLGALTGDQRFLQGIAREYEEMDPAIRERLAHRVATALRKADPTARCPPHHWLIRGLPHRAQRWTCVRCGAQRDYQVRPLVRSAARAVSAQT